VDWGLMTRGMMKILGVSRTVCLLNLCVSCLFMCECWWDAYHKRTIIIGNSKKSHILQIWQCNLKRGLWFFVKLVKQSMGSWNVLIFVHCQLVGWCSKYFSVYAIYLYSGVCITKCNLGLGFFKFNVVLGVYMVWSNWEYTRRLVGLRERKRLKRFNSSKTLSSLF
jgi:hypothetical protein